MLTKSLKKTGKAVYQDTARLASIELCGQRGLALDIGANVGLWSQDLCKFFSKVIAFEPVADFRECLRLNVPSANLEIRECALGAQDTKIDMIITADNTGHSHVNTASLGQGSIDMYRLDSFDLPHIDYIKIDCEGYELPILQGAEQTIRRYRPIMVLEDKKHKDVGHNQYQGAVDLLMSWGARRVQQIRSDVILAW